MTKNPKLEKLSDLPFQDMIRQRVTVWADQYDELNFPREMDIVKLTRRNRGDYFGYFRGTRRNRRWEAILTNGFVTFPVIERTIRSKVATGVSTRIQLQIEPYKNTPKSKAGAELANNIFKFLDANIWDKKFDTQLEEIKMLSRFAFVHSNYQKSGGAKVEVPEKNTRPKKTGITEFACINCGFTFSSDDLGIPDPADEYVQSDILEQLQSEDLDEDTREVAAKLLEAKPELEEEFEQLTERNEQSKQSEQSEIQDLGQIDASPEQSEEEIHNCPNCGEMAVYLTDRAKWELVTSLTGDYYETDCGKLVSKIVSPLLTRIDTQGCEGFEYQNADWFNYHPLIPAYQLLQIAPHLKEKISGGDYTKWSESTRFHHELNNDAGGYSYRGKDYYLDELVEVNLWWIAPHACMGWNSPELDELLSSTGEKFTNFNFKKGETVKEACERNFKEEFAGLALMMFDDEIVAIGNQHFLAQWRGVAHKVDPQSFFPQGEENLLPLQDAATNTLNMAHQYTRKMTMPKIVVNQMLFDADEISENVTGQILKTKVSSSDIAYDDWRKYLGYLQPADLPSTVWNIINLIIQIAKEASGVFNETVGNVETTDETLGGRRMALNQSLGLQTPPIQAKADAKREIAYLWLEMWQQHAPFEAYQLIKGTFEEEWKASDIQAFKELDIMNELNISIVDGTDVPRTQIEMEQRFMAAVSMNLFIEPNPLPLDIRQHIIKTVLGIDFDIQNYTRQKQSADVRFEAMKAELEQFSPEEAITVINDPNGFPVRQLLPEIQAGLAQFPKTQVRSTDSHLVFIEYFTDKLYGLLGAKEQDEVLIFGLEFMIDSHRAMIAAQTAQAASAEAVAGNAGTAVNQTNQIPMAGAVQ